MQFEWEKSLACKSVEGAPSRSQRRFPGKRALTPFLLYAGIACLLGTGIPTTLGLASFRPEATSKVSPRTLTFAERVAYQYAIEEVYWRHRIWPKENSKPKPSLDEVMPPQQIEKKVADYLRNSQALEDYWQRPLMTEQLQAEMERMAQHTKQPEVLRELFEALGNDPSVIAECLARPALAERLLRNWYAFDERIHGELKKRAEADLQVHRTVEQMKQLSGQYSEVELIRSDSSENAKNTGSAETSTRLTSSEWDEAVETLAAIFNKPDGASGSASEARRHVEASLRTVTELTAAEAYKIIPIGKLGPLQENETHFFVTAIIGKTADRLKIATVTWSKGSLEFWMANAENQIPAAMMTPSAAYTLPPISDGAGGCADDTWMATAIQGEGRDRHIAVWTGTEMIVWGGEVSLDLFSNSGERYNPGTDSWAATSTVNAPSARADLTAVWTGSEMIVWGGDTPGVWFNTGGRYNPANDSWTATSTTNAPDARGQHTAIWTGGEMIVWGGYFQQPPGTDHYVNTGGRYNPSTDSWTATNTVNAPIGRALHTTVLAGSEMIVWGGAIANSQWVNTGGRYNATTDSWAATSTVNAPSARASHTAVWSGSEMMVWGGFTFSDETNTGGRYNPSADSWTATSITNAPNGRYDHTAVWTGSEMIVWGGYGCLDPACLNRGYLNTGARYSPTTDGWVATNLTSAPTVRESQTAVWTGSEMIVWGGFLFDGNYHYLNTGGRYCAQSQAPMAQSAFSRKTHGAAGTFDIPLPLTGNVGIECRSGGATNDYQMVINFATAVTVGSASVTSGTGSVSSFSVSGSQVTVNLTGVTDAQTITVTLFNVNDGTNMGNVPVSMGVLVGDVNGNGAVSAADVALTKSQVGMPVGSGNFREDVNTNGTISATDVAQVKANVGTALPP